MSALPSWLEQIPVPVLVAVIAAFGALVGALAALIGVALTNRGHDRRLREQLAQDRALRTEERELSLRREICLNAAEAMESSLDHFIRIADPEIPNEKLTADYSAKIAPIGKVYAIATPDTARAVSRFSGDLEMAIIRMSARRRKPIRLIQQLTEVEAQIKDRLAKEPGKRFPDEELDSFQKLVLEMAQESFNLVEEVYKLNKELRLAYVPALIALRNELGLPIEGSVFEEILDARQKRGEKVIMPLLKGVREIAEAAFKLKPQEAKAGQVSGESEKDGVS